MTLLEILEHIPPSDLSYDEWTQVGMALKHEGFTAQDWDEWSRADSRYHAGECEKKWRSFKGSDSPVTAGTIVQMAKDRGLTFFSSGDGLLDFDGVITYEGEAEPVKKAAPRDPVQEIITYLRARFEPDEYIGYVTAVYEDQTTGKLSPTRGNWDRTAGQIIDLLEKCGGDIGSVLGDADTRAGAWIRVNPLDGKGIKDENVTDYRYVLVESDSLPIEQQNALIHDLELPVVTLTHTGGKSLHAIVHIGAKSREEYRQRVAYLFDVCEKNGLRIDKACKNPSRLTRLPGFRRGENWQYLIETNTGKGSFEEWRDFIEEIGEEADRTLPEVSEGLDDTADSADGLGDQLGDTADEAEKADKSIRRIAGAAAAIAIARKAAQELLGCFKAYSGYESAVMRVSDIFGSSAEAVEDFAERNAAALGMSRTAAYEYAATFGNLFRSITADQEENSRVTLAMLNASAVIASKTGRTVSDVMERIRSGLLGNTEAIEDLGIFVNVATEQ